MQNKIVTDIKQGNIQNGIATTTGGITKCLKRHEFFERRVKPINYSM
jgi:hypothetical protein